VKKAAGRGGARGGPAAKGDSGGGGPLILLVDDYADNRDMYAQYLKHAGFRVAEAEDGYDAIEVANALHPDLVVMDLALPRLDGWEATRRLKANARTREIPVLALTGHALTGFSASAREAGCDGFVIKPCLPEDLVGAIRRMLESRSGKPKSSKAR
jgi:CheY-like chemotaxis protein